MKHIGFKLLIVAALFMFKTNVSAQIQISVGTTMGQNFAIGTSPTATMPIPWRIDKLNSVRAVGSYGNAGTATEEIGGNNMGITNPAGIYNFGAGDASSASDRAVGWLSQNNNTESGNLYTCIKNIGMDSIYNFTISYDVEKYRKGSNPAGFTIQMYYSLNDTLWFDGGNDFKTDFSGGGFDNSGYNHAPGVTVNVANKTLDIQLNSGDSIFLAWNYSVTSGSNTAFAQALGIDNIVITANPFPPAFDATVTEWLLPMSNCNLSNSETVSVKVKNLGIDTITSLQLSYSVDSGQTFITPETFTGMILPNGGEITYSFSATADFSSTGMYYCVAAAYMLSDPNNTNDTLQSTVMSIPTVDVFPYFEDFEALNPWMSEGQVWEHGIPSQSGISSAKSGMKAWMTQLSSNYPNDAEESLYSPCFDFTSLNAPIFSAWLYLNIPDIGNDAMILEYTTDNGNNWLKVNGVTNFYNYTGTQGALSSPKWSGNSNGWYFVETPLTGLGNQNSVRLRFRFKSNSTTVGEGIAIDDIFIRDPYTTDLAIVEWIAPVSSCGMSDTTDVSVKITNVGADTVFQFPITYSLDNGLNFIPEEIYNDTLAPGDTIVYTFATQADLSQPDNYYFVVTHTLATDQNNLNDKIVRNITSLPYVTTYPYTQDNEMTFTGWLSGSISGPNQWEIGTPNQTALNNAFSGSKAWMTRLSLNYNNSAISYLMSPCYDFTNLTDPFFSSMLNIRTESGYDAMILEHSIDGGQTWIKVNGDQGFYNSNSNLGPIAPEKWSGNNGGWNKYETSLASLAGQANVRFRYVFTSNSSNNEEGIAIDDIIVRDKYENDLTVVDWVTPLGGCGMSNAEVVKVKIANLGKNSQTGFSIGYALNGGTFVFENFTTTINPNDTLTFTFATTADFSIPMDYGCMAIVNLNTDQNTINDAFYTSITCIPYISTYPYFQNFELGRAGWSSDAISGNDQWQFGMCNQTIVNFPKSGIAAWMTGLDADYDNNADCYLVSPCMSFATLTDPQISVWVNMRIIDEGNDAMILEKSIDGGNTWVKVTGGALYNYADSIGTMLPPKWSASTSGWTEFKAPLTGMAGETNVKLRFRFQSNDSEVNEGVAIDDILIHDPFANDIAILEWVSPISECNMSASESVTIKITNQGTVPQSNFGLKYSTDGGMTFTAPQNYTGVLNSGDTVPFTFSTTADFSVSNIYNCIAWATLTNDENTNNDIQFAKVYAVPTFNTFPYTADFEAFSSGWTSTAISGVDQWEHGSPNQLTLSYPHSGSQLWMTKLNGNYNNSSNSVLMSPCLNLQGITNPQLSIWLNSKTEPGYDAMILEKSLNGGSTWTKLDGDQGFYNNTNPNGPINNPPKWSGNTNGWSYFQTSATSLINQSSIRLRMRFASDATGNDEGFTVDDFMLFEPLNNDVGVTAILKPNNDICGSNTDSIFIEITNFGFSTQTQIPVKVEVLKPNTQVTTKYDTITSTLATGQSITVFIDTIGTVLSGTYFVFASTQLLADTINAFNNLTTTTFDIKLPLTLPYVEDMEGSNIEWTGDITIGQDHGAPSNVIYASLSSTNNNLESHSTKIGPLTMLSKLKFDYRIVDPSGNAYNMENGDFLQVFITNDCYSNNYMLFEINNGNHIAATEFRSLQFDLGAFNGDNIFLNFKYITNGHAFFVDIDNVIIANAPVVELGNDTSLCTGTVHLNAATSPQNTLYYWRELTLPDTISTAPTLLVTQSGYYHVSVDNGYGMYASDSVRIFINPLPVFDLGPNIQVCSGTPVDITASGGVSYHWNNGDTLPSITVNPTTVTNYSVTVTDNNGCYATDDINISTLQLPNVNLGSNQFLCGDGSITLNAGSNYNSYLWSTGATTQYITVDTVGIGYGIFTYTVTVTNSNNCNGSGSITLTFDPCIGTKDRTDESGINIYPNPSEGIFNLNITGQASDKLLLYIYNAEARMVYTQSIGKIYHNYNGLLNLKHLPKGIYYVKLIFNEQILIKKIIIM